MLSCDTSVALGAATFDGSTIFAKNSDRAANECQPLRHVPRMRHAKSDLAQCQYLEIPQVAETWELIGSRPWWLWGFEIGANEWGVAIGNEAVPGREPFEDRPALIGMDLVRLGLERGRTADEALTSMTELIERYGQGGSCEAPGKLYRTYHNSYIVADPSSAWILETAGRRWAAKRVHEKGAISNLFTIGTDYDRLSEGAAEHARAQGWSDGALDFGAAYQDPEADLRPRACRLDRAREILAGHTTGIRVRDMQALLSDHGTPDAGERAHGLPLGPQTLPSICVHPSPTRRGKTAAAMVAHLRPGRPPELTATVWTAFGSPCLSVFRPAYPFAVGLPAELDRGDGKYDVESPWWAFERLQRLVARAPSLAPLVRERLGELQAELYREAEETEARAGRLLAGGDRAGALGALRGLVDASTDRALALARELAEEVAPLAAQRAAPEMAALWDELNDEVGLLERERVPA